MEEKLPPTDQPQAEGLIENVTLSGRIQETLARMRQEDEGKAVHRRQGRPKGRISESLYERLRACNVPQLRTVKKHCDNFIRDQQTAPSSQECRPRHVVYVLLSITVRNKRFQLEFRRNSARAKRLYVNGPYVCAYWRDGKYIRQENFGKDKLRKLPRKFRSAMRSFVGKPEVEELRKSLQAKLDTLTD